MAFNKIARVSSNRRDLDSLVDPDSSLLAKINPALYVGNVKKLSQHLIESKEEFERGLFREAMLQESQQGYTMNG